MGFGDGRVFQRGKGGWAWIAYFGPRPNGSWGEIREPVRPRTADLEKALDFLRKRRRNAENHRDGIDVFQGRPQERITVCELLDSLATDYRQREIKSLRRTLGHLKPLREWFAARRAASVTADQVRAYIEQRQKDGLANATINHETELLGRAFRLAVAEGRLARCPKITRLRPNQPRQGFFEKAEFDAVAALLPNEVADVARFAYLTGWRKSEVTGLRWENVDRAAREIRISDSKNGEGRMLPLEGQLWTLIEKRWSARQYLDFRGEPALAEYVFHAQGKRLGQFSKIWTTAVKRASLPGKLFHDLRRTAVRDMIRAGVPQTVAMAISGHRTISVFQRYNITTSEDKATALLMRERYAEERCAKLNVVPLNPNPDKKPDTGVQT